MRSYPIGAIFIVLAFVWILQLLLSILQTQRFNKRVAELRREGCVTSVGLAGSNWKRKVFAVLVVDARRMIVSAEQLSGFTVFAKLRPVPGVLGLPMQCLDGEPLEGISKKTWQAMNNAAEYVKKKDSSVEVEQETEQA